MIRTAMTVWHGTGRDGSGKVTTQSGSLHDAALTYKTRFGDDKGTNPEELIAAAHAGCFTMTVAFALQAAGHLPDTLTTTAALTIEPYSGSYRITKSALTLRAVVPNLAEEEFKSMAKTACGNCPVSKILNIEITLDAELA